MANDIEGFDLSPDVMTEYVKLIPYMVDPVSSANELLHFKKSYTNNSRGIPLLQSEHLVDELKQYGERIRTNRGKRMNTQIEIGDIDGFIRHNFDHLYSGSRFVPRPSSGCSRLNVPGAPFPGSNPGYSHSTKCN